MNKNDSVIVAAFPNEAAAEAAIVSLREWDKRSREVQLGAIGLVHHVDGATKADVVHGSLFNRSLPISDDAVRVLGQELDSRVAVVVACDDYEADMVSDLLTRGGAELLARKGEHTRGEGAEEERKVDEALMERAIYEAVEAAKISPNRNIYRPV